MKHLFLPYKLAVIAKGKGFDEPCLKYYYIECENILYSQEDLDSEPPHKVQNKFIGAPLYQQIVDWLIINKELYPVVFPTTNKKMYCAVLYRTPNNEIYQSIERFDNYYKALNRLIEEAFRLI